MSSSTRLPNVLRLRRTLLFLLALLAPWPVMNYPSPPMTSTCYKILSVVLMTSGILHAACGSSRGGSSRGSGGGSSDSSGVGFANSGAGADSSGAGTSESATTSGTMSGDNTATSASSGGSGGVLAICEGYADYVVECCDGLPNCTPDQWQGWVDFCMAGYDGCPNAYDCLAEASCERGDDCPNFGSGCQ